MISSLNVAEVGRKPEKRQSEKGVHMTELRIGLRIALAREALKMTQEELADKAELSRVTINRIENGRTNGMSTRTLLRLANALQVDASYLLCG